VNRHRKRGPSKWHLATRILAERRTVQSRLAALEREAPARSPVGGYAAESPAAEIMEAAQDSVTRELMFASREVLARRLKALARAEAKIREGTYGRCDVCGQPISAARLQALPEAVRCVPCAKRLVPAA
jgi:RNA polymerase-binding transcription factor DksA